MKNALTKHLRFASLIAVVLIAAMVLTACGGKTETKENTGLKTFTFTVVDPDGNSESFTLESEAATVGEALMAEGLIKGEDGPYGLYVKEVKGIPLDYETHGMYWAFYVNGEYAMTGVDQTPVEHDAQYMLKAEAAE